MELKRPPAPRSARGFTLIELLVTIALGAIIMTLAVPSFSSYIRTQRVRAASEGLYSSLTLARAEAIKRNAEVTLAPKVEGDWSQGWEITTAGVNAPLLQQQAWSGVALDTALAGDVVYLHTGRPGSGAAASFTLCDEGRSESVTQRVLSIDPSGYASITLGEACS